MNRPADAAHGSAQDANAEPAWSCEEIERLYQQALDAVEAVAHDLTSVSQTLSAEADGDDPSAVDEGEPASGIASPAEPEPGSSSPSADEETRPEPAQVIEALLFVGGQPLTAKTICGLLRGDFDADFVERAIEEMNLRYSRQNRPYEIRPGEGGYRIVVLRGEYEPLLKPRLRIRAQTSPALAGDAGDPGTCRLSPTNYAKKNRRVRQAGPPARRRGSSRSGD